MSDRSMAVLPPYRIINIDGDIKLQHVKYKIQEKEGVFEHTCDCSDKIVVKEDSVVCQVYRRVFEDKYDTNGEFNIVVYHIKDEVFQEVTSPTSMWATVENKDYLKHSPYLRKKLSNALVVYFLIDNVPQYREEYGRSLCSSEIVTAVILEKSNNDIIEITYDLANDRVISKKSVKELQESETIEFRGVRVLDGQFYYEIKVIDTDRTVNNQTLELCGNDINISVRSSDEDHRKYVGVDEDMRFALLDLKHFRTYLYRYSETNELIGSFYLFIEYDNLVFKHNGIRLHTKDSSFSIMDLNISHGFMSK